MRKIVSNVMLIFVLVSFAPLRSNACMIYSAPDHVSLHSSPITRIRRAESYIRVILKMRRHFEQSVDGVCDNELNSAILSEIYAVGENDGSYNNVNSEDRNKPIRFPTLPGYIYMIIGSIVAFVVFGEKRYRDAKRLFDIIVSLIALIVFCPILLICIILIRIDSKGPVLFRQIRVGLNRRKEYDAGFQDLPRRRDENMGKLFYMYKLRTMYIDAEAKSGPIWAKKNDSRITGIGKILRKTHLDEIPQFYNVLQGDMSIIGPRPERPVFVNENKKYFNGRFGVKPGITGLAQVRQSYAATLGEIKKKLRYDKLYIKKQSIVVDIAILLNTFRRVLADNAAH